MKILILTTETTHHNYFVKKIHEISDDLFVIYETKKPKVPEFKIYHKFEDEMVKYERNLWFNSKNKKLKFISNSITFNSVNDSDCIKLIDQINPDLTFVFGTGILNKKTISKINTNLFNFHGGDPEMYRGLDSHLWSIYHNDYNSLVSTLHKVEPTLDTGEILFKRKIKINKNLKLHQLRSLNTQECVKMAKDTINCLSNSSKIFSYKQKTKGRYYSFMPAVLKEICLNKFNNKNSDYNYGS